MCFIVFFFFLGCLDKLNRYSYNAVYMLCVSTTCWLDSGNKYYITINSVTGAQKKKRKKECAKCVR